MKNLDLIETSRHILKIHDVKNIQINKPSTHILSRTGAELWIIGTEHTRDTQNPQIHILKTQFANFINQHYKNPIVCLEGFMPNDLKDEDSAIQTHGEKAALILKAQESGIKMISVEPTQDEISKWAMEIFPHPFAHAAWAILNVLMYPTNSLTNALPAIANVYGFKENQEEFYKKISEYLRQENIVTLPNNLKHLSISSIDLQRIQKAQEPNDGPFPTNKAGSFINLARDYGLFRNTIIALEEDKHDGVFAWFGQNHVLEMMPAFKYAGFIDKKIPTHC